jgi:hypothetical protein
MSLKSVVKKRQQRQLVKREDDANSPDDHFFPVQSKQFKRVQEYKFVYI